MEAELTEEERRKEALRKAGQEYFENVLKKAAVGRDPFAPAPSSSPSRLALGTSHRPLPVHDHWILVEAGRFGSAHGESDSCTRRFLLRDDEAVQLFAIRGLLQTDDHDVRHHHAAATPRLHEA